MYLGKLNVKHKMQIRTLRQTHCDSAYCNALFKYFKSVIMELAVVIHDTNPNMVARFISMDDKAKVIICVFIVIVDIKLLMFLLVLLLLLLMAVLLLILLFLLLF